jgi:hypothetical protein
LPKGGKDRSISAEKNSQGKEAKTMKYTKPEVLLLGPAVSAVQAHQKDGENLDSAAPTYSTAAYEVDE